MSETALLSVPTRKRARVEGATEWIFPTEYDAESRGWNGRVRNSRDQLLETYQRSIETLAQQHLDAANSGEAWPPALFETPPVFETRSVGLSLELTAHPDNKGEFIELKMGLEWTQRPPLETPPPRASSLPREHSASSDDRFS